MNEKEKVELLKRLEEHLKLKNYSKDTLKAYSIHAKKYLEFLGRPDKRSFSLKRSFSKIFVGFQNSIKLYK